MRPIALSMIIALATPAGAQDNPTLLLVHEVVRSDSATVFDANEMAVARTCIRLGCPHAYLALVSESPGDVWWLNAFASAADKRLADREWASRRELLIALQSLSRRKEQLRESISTYSAGYRADLSTGPILTLSGARFVVMSKDTTPPSHSVSSAIFATPDAQYFAIRAAQTVLEATHLKKMMGAAAHVYRVEPRWSVPEASWIAKDPMFWRRPAAEVGGAATQSRPRASPLSLSELREGHISFCQLPNLDVAGSSPVACSAVCLRKNAMRRSDDVARRFFLGHIGSGTRSDLRCLSIRLGRRRSWR
jgi:hypothetical protein